MQQGRIRGLRFSLESARSVFPGVTARRLVLAVLAAMRPEARWSGDRLLLAPSVEGEPDTACVLVEGPDAAAIGEHLADAFDHHGIAWREGSPDDVESRFEVLVEARDGAWV